MPHEQRDELIDAYFASLDEEGIEPLEPYIATDFTYVHPETSVDGIEGLRTFFRDRAPQDTTHELYRRLHAETASVVEGRLTGELADGTPREGEFCDVFEFDKGDDKFTRVAVYARL